MPRTIWTKLQSDPNGTWTRHEGDPPFSIPAVPGQAHDVLTDAGESFVVTPLEEIVTPVAPVLAAVKTAPDAISVTSTEAGTLYYGLYPAGTTGAEITAAALIAGADTGQIAGGTAGVFVAAGTLTDALIDTSALAPGTDYVVTFVLDIDDSGTYSNLALEGYTALDAPAAKAVLEAAYIGQAIRQNNGTTSYGFTGVPIGAEAADREVYVVAQYYNRALTRASFNAGAATDASPLATSGSATNMAIFRAAIPTGTTADIDLTFNAAPDGGVKLSVFRVTGKSAETAGGTFTAGNVAIPATGTIAVAQGGAVIGAGGERGGNTDSVILTGIAKVGTNFDTYTQDTAHAGLATGLAANPAYSVGVSKTTTAGAVSAIFMALE